MEGIEAEIEEKILERQPPAPQVGVEVIEKVIEKPKKPRTQAQKDAFEKARKKRADNLALKKAERVEEELKSMNDPTPMEVMTQNKIEAPKKKRGRPKGSKKTKIVNEEPPLQQFIPPPQGYPPMPYPIQGHPQYYHQPPPPQPAPVNNYYYYGAPPHPQQVVSFAEEELVQEYDVSEEEEYEIPIDPRHKFRFK